MIKGLITLLVQLYLSKTIVKVILILVIFGLTVSLVYSSIYRRKKRHIMKLKTHLNHRELLVFNILNQKEGKCYQSTLSFLSKMPKSSLSEMILELEQRNIVTKTKKGNKNIISIKY